MLRGCWAVGEGDGVGLVWCGGNRNAEGRMDGVPGVRDDNVVEWGVFSAEAGEAYSEDHCVVCGGICDCV